MNDAYVELVKAMEAGFDGCVGDGGMTIQDVMLALDAIAAIVESTARERQPGISSLEVI